jgi:hypothetical protein
MPYEFREWEKEREPQASSGHSVIPPGDNQFATLLPSSRLPR